MDMMTEIASAVDRWCPRAFSNESFTQQAIRAFLNARACVKDLRRVAAGQQPIRPLETYPEDP